MAAAVDSVCAWTREWIARFGKGKFPTWNNWWRTAHIHHRYYMAGDLGTLRRLYRAEQRAWYLECDARRDAEDREAEAVIQATFDAVPGFHGAPCGIIASYLSGTYDVRPCVLRAFRKRVGDAVDGEWVPSNRVHHAHLPSIRRLKGKARAKALAEREITIGPNFTYDRPKHQRYRVQRDYLVHNGVKVRLRDTYTFKSGKKTCFEAPLIAGRKRARGAL
jgi:hypothetical protein